MNVLVIGCGSIGKRHIRNLMLLGAAKILAFDIDIKRLEEVKKISKTIVVSSNINKLWKFDPEVAFITLPTSLHISYAIKAAVRGCHLFIEKPLSHNLKGIAQLLNIAEEKRLINFVGYNFRFHDHIKKIKNLIDKNAIGKIISGRTHSGSYLPERHPWEDYRLGYGARRTLGGGVILDCLCHHLDYWFFLFGRPNKVFCCSGHLSRLEIDVEDIAEILMLYKKDKAIVSLHADYVQHPYTHTLELIGEGGTIFCDFVNNKLRYYNVEKHKWINCKKVKEHNAFYVKEIKYFLKCVKTHTVSDIDINEAKKELEVLLKIKKSNFSGKWVKI